MYYQRRVKGGRFQLPSMVIDKLHHEIDVTAKRFNCSRSFVIATALSEQFGIDIGEAYYEVKKLRRKPKEEPAKLLAKVARFKKVG